MHQTTANKDSAKILEIGSGLGYLTYALIKSGYNCYGLDISETAVNQAILEYGNYYICDNIFDFGDKELESFDLIILTEVIEHIDAPVSFFKSLWKLVKPHGRVVITTPNKSFFPSDIIWFGDCPPVHYWNFSEESMSCIARQLNANITFVDFSSYYKVHYTWVDIDKLRKYPHSISVLDKSGQVKKMGAKKSFPVLESLRKGMSRLPFLKKIVRKIRKILNPSIIIGGRRGPVMCAIFEKL